MISAETQLYYTEKHLYYWTKALETSFLRAAGFKLLQALFARLQQLATVAGDVLLGKEKLQKVLLARLTETIVMWLSDEQEFWGVFEDESVPLKPSGLQQVLNSV